MSGQYELGVSTPALGVAVVGLGVVGLQLGGLTTRLLGGTVPVPAAFTGVALAAVVGWTVGFWLGSAESTPAES
ncbi:hypothetical protein [Halorussus sp. AFM4]|uniref:hypothetical protein n=1 Tax=Halorussus sp. AFM4 TaxID=3421651 RepID=UPI003EB87B72